MNRTKVAINGFGRIGRLTARIIIDKHPNIEIVSINDLTSSDNLAYLYNHDSNYRHNPKHIVTSTSNQIIINDQTIEVFANREPVANQWQGIDTVLECTGKFLTTDLANLHIQAGAKKVILSAPAKDNTIPTFVIGCNQELIGNNQIISNASCTTNCLAPIVKILDQSILINSMMGITVHAITASQVIQDAPSQKDFRDGRASSINLIPSKTGASKAVELVVPNIKGKLNLSSLRAPIITGSYIYLVINTDKEYTKEEVNNILQNASKILPDIIEYSTEELVSTDIIGNSHSVIVDSKLTETIQKQIKICLWYDNEWGYSNRLADLLHLFKK